MDKKDRVAVVMGGPSKEREVSLNTGNAILNALKEKAMMQWPSTWIRNTSWTS